MGIGVDVGMHMDMGMNMGVDVGVGVDVGRCTNGGAKWPGNQQVTAIGGSE